MFDTTGNTITDRNGSASASPSAENTSAANAIAATSSARRGAVTPIPIVGENGSSSSACSHAISAPEPILPSAMSTRRTGDTSSAFRRPVCRSCTMPIAAEIAVNISDSPITPGKM